MLKSTSFSNFFFHRANFAFNCRACTSTLAKNNENYNRCGLTGQRFPWPLNLFPFESRSRNGRFITGSGSERRDRESRRKESCQARERVPNASLGGGNDPSVGSREQGRVVSRFVVGTANNPPPPPRSATTEWGNMRGAD